MYQAIWPPYNHNNALLTQRKNFYQITIATKALNPNSMPSTPISNRAHNGNQLSQSSCRASRKEPGRTKRRYTMHRIYRPQHGIEALPTSYEHLNSNSSLATSEQQTGMIHSEAAPARRPPLVPVHGRLYLYASEPMSEEWTDIVHAPESPFDDIYEIVEEPACDSDEGSNTSSLKRRGAVRRHANPLFTRLTAQDFRRCEGTGTDYRA